jgi:type IV secretory pathway TraG/TraD family ATPase VirD4
LLPQEILRLDPRLMLVLRPGMRPTKMRRLRWFEDPYLKSLYRPPPEIPKMDIRVPLDDGKTKLPQSGQQTKGKKTAEPSPFARRRPAQGNGRDAPASAELSDGDGESV